MKKLILFLCLIAAVFAVQAQSTAHTKAITFTAGQSYNLYNFSSTADTITHRDTLARIQWQLNTAAPVKYNAFLSLHKVSGSPRVAVSFQGKVYDDDTWSNITTATWTGTTADTIIRFTQNSTAQYYRYFQIYSRATTTAQKSYLKKAALKLWYP